MRVVLRDPHASDGADYRHSLVVCREYVVIGRSIDCVRLVNELGEPALYEIGCFEVTDPVEPTFWVSEVDDGCRYADPPGWGVPGFFEDWFDGDKIIRRVFAEQLAHWYPDIRISRSP